RKRRSNLIQRRPNMERSLQSIDSARHPRIWLPPISPEASAGASRWPEQRRFRVLERAFRKTGGIVCGDDLASLLRGRWEQPLSKVARWIVGRHAVSFTWRSAILLPMFQFDPPSLALRPSVADVVEELRDVFDDWDLASWFAEPNAWLGDAAPVDLI